MKLSAGLLAAAAATMCVGAALADDSDKFVVRGDATKILMEQNQINIATAEAIAKACVDEAVKQGVRVSIVIYDQFGEPVYMYRMDGQAKIAIDTAMMKAKTVINTRAPSKAVMNQVLSGRASELRQFSFGNFGAVFTGSLQDSPPVCPTLPTETWHPGRFNRVKGVLLE